MACGISAVMPFTTCSIRSFSTCWSACFALLSSMPLRMEFFSSSRVSYSLTSMAKSSSRAGSSLYLTSCSLTLKVASLPASSLAWYSSGNLTLTSNSSPALWPTICSSKPGIKEPLPASESSAPPCRPRTRCRRQSPQSRCRQCRRSRPRRHGSACGRLRSCMRLSSASTWASSTVLTFLVTFKPA